MVGRGRDLHRVPRSAEEPRPAGAGLGVGLATDDLADPLPVLRRWPRPILMLTDALHDLGLALERRVATAPNPERAESAERLRRHVVDYLRPRARNVGAPLVIVILGSTGSGKSSLLNALAGRLVSPSGVLRPTTLRPTAVVHPADAGQDLPPGLTARDAVDFVADPRRGVVSSSSTRPTSTAWSSRTETWPWSCSRWPTS